MTRLNALNPDEASGREKELFNAIHAKLGVVPNMMRTMAISPALLEGYLSLNGALNGGSLGIKTGELIALTVAEINSCNYCLSAHTYLGTNVAKLTDLTMELARNASSTDVKTEAILNFAQMLVLKRGLVNDVDVQRAKAAGVTNKEIVEVIGHVALNILTNYFNNTANTEIDFPLVHAFSPAQV